MPSFSPGTFLDKLFEFLLTVPVRKRLIMGKRQLGIIVVSENMATLYNNLHFVSWSIIHFWVMGSSPSCKKIFTTIQGTTIQDSTKYTLFVFFSAYTV